MILAIEIENSKINFGIFNSCGALNLTFSVATDINKTSDEYAILLDGILNYYKVDRTLIEGVSLCSVVPMITNIIIELMRDLFENATIIQVQKGIKTGFSIKVDNPSELGADLVANAAAALAIQNNENLSEKSCIIINISTATTVFALNEKREFIGGCIFPGIDMSFKSLHGNTAQLPNVLPTLPTKAIGKNSQDSIRSGVILGTAMMIDGFIERFSKEMYVDNPNIFVTGEYAQKIIELCSSNYRYIPSLTLYGLYSIYKNNNS